jgi:hypothetical protein
VTPLQLFAAFASGAICAWISRKRGQKPFQWIIWFAIGALLALLGLFIFPFLWLARSQKKSRKRTVPRKPREPILAGPTDKLWYYLDEGTNQQQGPLSHTALETARRSGKLSPATLVWHEELTEWAELRSLLQYK